MENGAIMFLAVATRFQFVCQLFTLSSSTRGHCRLCSKALTVAHQRQIVDFVS